MESVTQQGIDEDFLDSPPLIEKSPARQALFFPDSLHEGFQLHITGLDSN